MDPQPDEIRFLARMRPISVCAGCDRPIPDEEGVVVKYANQVEDYCRACYDATIRLPHAC